MSHDVLSLNDPYKWNEIKGTYVPFSLLLVYIGTATSEWKKRRI